MVALTANSSLQRFPGYLVLPRPTLLVCFPCRSQELQMVRAGAAIKWVQQLQPGTNKLLLFLFTQTTN